MIHTGYHIRYRSMPHRHSDRSRTGYRLSILRRGSLVCTFTALVMTSEKFSPARWWHTRCTIRILTAWSSALRRAPITRVRHSVYDTGSVHPPRCRTDHPPRRRVCKWPQHKQLFLDKIGRACTVAGTIESALRRDAGDTIVAATDALKHWGTDIRELPRQALITRETTCLAHRCAADPIDTFTRAALTVARACATITLALNAGLCGYLAPTAAVHIAVIIEAQPPSHTGKVDDTAPTDQSSKGVVRTSRKPRSRPLSTRGLPSRYARWVHWCT